MSDYLQTKLGKINSKGEYYNDVYLPIKDNCKQEGNFMDSESPTWQTDVVNHVKKCILTPPLYRSPRRRHLQYSRLKVESIMPTFVFFKGGKEIERFSGADENKLSQLIERLK